MGGGQPKAKKQPVRLFARQTGLLGCTLLGTSARPPAAIPRHRLISVRTGIWRSVSATRSAL